MIVLTGVIARRRNGTEGGDSMEQQTLAVLRRVVELVEGQGGGVQNVYKLVIYVTDIARKDEVNKARAAFFTGTLPCSTLVEV